MTENNPSHFIIIADLRSASIARLEAEIVSLGTAQELAPQVWALRAARSLATIRNTLMQKVGRSDTLFVVDASHDRIMWLNCPPSTEARLKQIWNKELQSADYLG